MVMRCEEELMVPVVWSGIVLSELLIQAMAHRYGSVGNFLQL